jgi:RNA methyltransferase, TrmH family
MIDRPRQNDAGRIVVKALTSGSNPLYRRWLKLATQSRAVREQGQTLAEGLHLAHAALDAGTPIAAAILRRGGATAEREAILARLAAAVPHFELAAELYDRICTVEHGAGLTLVVPVAESSLPSASDRDLVYLDTIQDPVNVGALLRSAAASGIHAVLCSPGCASAWAPRAMRAAMGAHFRLRICEGVDPQVIEACLDGPWIAAMVRDAPALWTASMPRTAIGWAFGSEGSGLSAATLSRCSLRVSIPMSRDAESLNVAAAAAICLFERRRREDPGVRSP